MDGYGITTASRRGTAQYRLTGTDQWELAEAEEIAHRLLDRSPVIYVSVGDGEHEFRAWGTDVTSYGYENFDHPGIRWAAWYVDVEINGHRWRYRPVADLDSYDTAEEIAERAATLEPDVTRIWIGASDGSEEFELQTRER